MEATANAPGDGAREAAADVLAAGALDPAADVLAFAMAVARFWLGG